MRSLLISLCLVLLPAPLGLPYVGVDDGAVPVATPKVEDANDRARRIGREAARSRGWTGKQWDCLDRLIKRESNWRPTARNGSHYGVGQVKGMKPGTPIRKQMRIVLRYIEHRYDTPCRALAHSLERNWY